MDSRYKIVSYDKCIRYTKDCPIILKAVAVTKDQKSGRVFAQCKFENLTDKIAVAVYVSLACKNLEGEELQCVNLHKYMDLHVEQNCEFGDKTPIDLPANETRRVVITIQKIIFLDGEIWENIEKAPLKAFKDIKEPITKLKPLDEKYIKEVNKITGKMTGWYTHENLPYEFDNFIRCGCGKLTLKTCKKCSICGADFESLLKLQDQEYLSSLVNEENKNKAENKVKTKKIIKIIMVMLSLVALVAGIIFINSPWFTTHIKSESIIVLQDGKTIDCDGFKYREYYDEHVNDSSNPYEGVSVTAVGTVDYVRHYKSKVELRLKNGWLIYAVGGSGIAAGDRLEVTGIVAEQSKDILYTELEDVHYSLLI